MFRDVIVEELSAQGNGSTIPRLRQPRFGHRPLIARFVRRATAWFPDCGRPGGPGCVCRPDGNHDECPANPGKLMGGGNRRIPRRLNPSSKGAGISTAHCRAWRRDFGGAAVGNSGRKRRNCLFTYGILPGEGGVENACLRDSAFDSR